MKVPFLLDDYGKIIRNQDIKSLENIPSRLIYPYETPPRFHRNDPSRPLTFLSLTLNYHFNHLEPYGYHVVNIGLHATVVLLIFLLGLMLFSLVGISGIALPFVAALLFAVHPINVNVVSYVMGRAASLATVFYLLAVILFVRKQQKVNGSLVGSVICFVLAIASNQLALTLPVIILLTDYCFFSAGDIKNIAQKWKQHTLYWVLFAAYLFWRITYFGQLGDVEATALSLDRKGYFLTEIVAIWKYIGLIFWPGRLSFEHLYGPFNTITEPKVQMAIVGYIVLLTIAWRKKGLMLFGVLWFFITLAPTSSIFPTTATLAENRVYLPAIGIALVIPFTLHMLFQRDYPITVALCICAAMLAPITFQRNMLYQNAESLWRDIIKKYPDHVRAHKNLGVEYFKQQKFNDMAEAFEHTVRLDPDDLDAQSNLAAAYYNLGRYQDALKTYRRIIQGKPDYAPAYSNIGMVYEQLSNTNMAISAYETAIRLDPTLIEPLNNLGGIYFEKGHFSDSAAMFHAALQIDPHNTTIIKNYENASSRIRKP